MLRRYPIPTALLVSLIPALGVQGADPERDRVAQAVKAGQDYLRACQRGGQLGMPDILAMAGGHGTGTACLTGLALIESGVPSDDPVVDNIARLARRVAISSTNTYEISLLIMFLDRYGAQNDEALIQFLTLRLLSGQTTDGAWSYTCSGLSLNPVEERMLANALIREDRIATPDTPRPPKPKAKAREDLDFDTPPRPPAKKDSPTPKVQDRRGKLHPALENIARAIRAGRGGPGGGVFGMVQGGDHSNTQFATVGLWCGRRHGVDVTDALTALDKYYRACQGQDGGWAYTASGGGSSPAMTCAGLMGLAMGFGAQNLDGAGKRADPDAIAGDRAVTDALKFLGNFLAAAGDQRGGGGFVPNDLSKNLYFMWSLERVGMVYGLTTIGRVDWYEWGSKSLVATQQRDGSWRSDGFHGGSAENSTAFALLFLSKANLAEDLATSMKGKVKDPGTSRLVRGGDLSKMLEGISKGSDSGRPNPGVKTPPKSEPPASIGEAGPAGRLAAELVASAPADRPNLLATYRDTRGGEYTDALARAAARMTGDAQVQVRDALAQRLTRMTSATLNDLMRDRDGELRRAAALAVAAKGRERLPEFAPNLIRLTADEEVVVSQAARTTLKSLSGQDFGPASGSAADRGKAVIAWRNWWESQKK